MSAKSFPVEVQPDYLSKITRASPVSALAELIWNGLDADANRVSVQFLDNAMGGLAEIIVRDGGTGFPYEQAPTLFGRLGGSWKHGGQQTPGGRFLHGQEGRGRFKALGLGRIAEWDVTYERDDERWNFTIELNAENIRSIRISDETRAEAGKPTGAVVRISELHKDYQSLREETARQDLTEIFALYLTDYRSVKIEVDGAALDADSLIVSRQCLPIAAEHEGQPVTGELELIEWVKSGSRALFLCNERGMPLLKPDRRFPASSHSFTAYLRSPLITQLQNEGTLELAEMNPGLALLLDNSQQTLKDHFRAKDAEIARSLVEQWKRDHLYPYSEDAGSPVEVAERQVFDIVAVNMARSVPSFADTPKPSKALSLRLLRQALERSSGDLEVILDEVLRLPPATRKDLAGLLRETSLSSVIGAARTVADRLKFLFGLEAVIFDQPSRKKLKERSQLHRIIADNAWLFGEQYSLSVDDQSLTQVLRKHRQLLGDSTVISEPVKHVTKTRGIVDLVLSKTIRRHNAGGVSHLVVELKAPSVKVDEDEIRQIEQYARSISNDERFRSVDVTWDFWVISNELGPAAIYRMEANPESPGLIYKGSNKRIWIKTWAEVLEDNRGRLQFFREKLDHQADKQASVEFLRQKYAAYLEGIHVDGELLEDDQEFDEEAQQVA
jgi:hypothetical protein